MITMGRAVCLAQRQLIIGRSGQAFFHSLKVYKPPACLTRISVVNRVYPVRHKLIFTKKPQSFSTRHEKDGMKSGYELVYVNNMNRYYFWSQVFIYGLLTPTLCCTAYFLWANRDDLRERVEQEELEHPYFIGLPAVVIGVALILFTNVVCRRAIIRMYHNENRKTYTAVTQKWNMLHEKFEFTAEDCVPQSKSSLSAQFFLAGNVLINDRKFLIRDTDFRQPVFYNDIMGWDRAEQDRRESTNDDITDFIRSKKKSRV